MAPGSRWRKLPMIAAWALAPVLFAQAFYHLRGEADAGSLACWVLAGLPPLAATTAGAFAFRSPRGWRIAVSLVACLLAYPLPAAAWLLVFLPGVPAAASMGRAFAVLFAVPRFMAGLSQFAALLAGGAVLGSYAATAIYRVVKGRARHRDVGGHRRVTSQDAELPGRGNDAERGVRWLGAGAGAAAIMSLFWFSNVPDVMLAMVLYSLTLGAWLSAACVVLVLGPKSAARDEPGDSPAGGSEPP